MYESFAQQASGASQIPILADRFQLHPRQRILARFRRYRPSPAISLLARLPTLPAASLGGSSRDAASRNVAASNLLSVGKP